MIDANATVPLRLCVVEYEAEYLLGGLHVTQSNLMTKERTAPKMLLAVTGFVLAALVVVVTSTTKTKTTPCGTRFYENTTLKFQVSVVPHQWVDPSGQRCWIATWPGGTKCVAGVSIPLSGRQFTFQLLRWSWKG